MTIPGIKNFPGSKAEVMVSPEQNYANAEWRKSGSKPIKAVSVIQENLF